jgi:hypothetical protein
LPHHFKLPQILFWVFKISLKDLRGFHGGDYEEWRLLGCIVFLHSMSRLLVTANVPSSPILVTLMMEELSSSETSVLTRATRRNIPEGAILQKKFDAMCRNEFAISDYW